MPCSFGVAFVVAGAALPAALGTVVFGAVWILLGVLRALWWAKVCTTSQLVDDGDHLVWMYKGQRREVVAWEHLKHLLFQRWARSRQISWTIGGTQAGPFPYVLIDSRADPPPGGFRHFADIMVMSRADLEAADNALAGACERHGVTYHGIWSDW
ncbi:hypothetical protein [Actinopolymorpha rutila]|uniref:Uncharacterized protein n=1 Tax=Actinopolymorpha rutila TaxID=446787 RepID=A0A852ZIS2_9ACTN|nr:hypothetical protein [Actinopolymorpha rutila]NYH92844.1 hypothetical protein [Actinopolymorpha rutila]